MNTQTETTVCNPRALSGVALDWAVGTALEKKLWFSTSGHRQVFVKQGRGSYWYNPTSGGGLNATLESYGFDLIHVQVENNWIACFGPVSADGASPVEAVLRLVCLLEIGDQVAVPTALL